MWVEEEVEADEASTARDGDAALNAAEMDSRGRGGVGIPRDFITSLKSSNSFLL